MRETPSEKARLLEELRQIEAEERAPLPDEIQRAWVDGVSANDLDQRVKKYDRAKKELRIRITALRRRIEAM